MTVGRWPRGPVFLLALLTLGCAPAQLAGPPAAAPVETLDACCARPETFPPDLVALVERGADRIMPWARNLDLRRPRLAGHPEALRAILDAAEPLDVVTVTTKYHLAGWLAAGVMTHALVYVGSEAELRRAGLWSHPALRPWKGAIRDGARFIEAIDPAVRLSTPAAALRADSIALFRPRLGPQARQRALGTLLGAIGTRFDTHFRLDSDGCLFCTELIARAMPGLDLRVREIYGRRTIMPDDIAASALRGDGRLRFVAYARGRRGGWDLTGPEALVADLAAAWQRKR